VTAPIPETPVGAIPRGCPRGWGGVIPKHQPELFHVHKVAAFVLVPQHEQYSDLANRNSQNAGIAALFAGLQSSFSTHIDKYSPSVPSAILTQHKCLENPQ